MEPFGRKISIFDKILRVIINNLQITDELIPINLAFHILAFYLFNLINEFVILPILKIPRRKHAFREIHGFV